MMAGSFTMARQMTATGPGTSLSPLTQRRTVRSSTSRSIANERAESPLAAIACRRTAASLTDTLHFVENLIPSGGLLGTIKDAVPLGTVLHHPTIDTDRPAAIRRAVSERGGDVQRTIQIKKVLSDTTQLSGHLLFSVRVGLDCPDPCNMGANGPHVNRQLTGDSGSKRIARRLLTLRADGSE